MAIFGWASVERELRKHFEGQKNELVSVVYRKKNIPTFFSPKLTAPCSQKKTTSFLLLQCSELWFTGTLTHADAKTFHTGKLSGDTGELDFYHLTAWRWPLWFRLIKAKTCISLILTRNVIVREVGSLAPVDLHSL